MSSFDPQQLPTAGRLGFDTLIPFFPWGRFFHDQGYIMPYPEVTMASEDAYARYTQISGLLMTESWEAGNHLDYVIERPEEPEADSPPCTKSRYRQRGLGLSQCLAGSATHLSSTRCSSIGAQGGSSRSAIRLRANQCHDLPPTPKVAHEHTFLSKIAYLSSEGGYCFYTRREKSDSTGSSVAISWG